MPEPIQTIPLGLLAGAMQGAPMGLLAGLNVPGGAASPRRTPPAAPDAPRPFAGLFNNQPSGYTPEDVQKIVGDRASYFQSFPIVPQWNGGKGAGGILPGVANFGSGFMGSYVQGQQEANARENERIRREAGNAASNATDLDAAVRALQGGSPEQANAALQVRLQALVKDRERARQAEIMQQVYGAPPAAADAPTSAPAPAAPATSSSPPVTAPAPAQPAQSTQPNQLRTSWSFPTDAPPYAPSAPAAVDPASRMPAQGEVPPAPPVRPQHSLGIEGVSPEQLAQLPANREATSGLTSGVAPQAAPAQQPAQLPTPDPIVQIGQFRLPLSEARRRAALGRAQGVDVKPLEEAIQLAEEPLRAQARERGKALGEAQVGLPQAIQAAQSTIDKIDEVARDPQLQRIIGFSPYNPIGYLPNSPEQRALVNRIQQVQGRFFLQAFDALRGGGQITEKEGEKAQAAIARIQDIHQDYQSYTTALKDARREVWSLTNIARQRAGLAPIPYQPAPPISGEVQNGYQFNGGDPANPQSWVKVQ